MKILSVNAGSSSLKFKGFEMPEEKVLISGTFERIGIGNSFYTIKVNGQKARHDVELTDHKQAFEILVKELLDNNIVTDLSEIKGIGHRVVQGGSFFDKTVVVDNDVIGKIDELSQLAPLHNPAAIVGINAAREVVPGAIQTAVFDTAFHQTMPKYNYLYALPYEWYDKYQVRKYGAHGTSHKYISNRMNEILGRTDTKIITCHIGNGASISAVLNGKCINTSMGLTPNAGLIMGSRCGDIDATIIPYIMEKTNLTPKEINNILNKQSGLLALSHQYSDFRDINAGFDNNDENCTLALTMYVRRVADYIAKYYVEMKGCDAIVLTAGVCENAELFKRKLLEQLDVLGIKIDENNIKIPGEEIKITTDDSKIPVYVIPTDEEVMMARDTYEFIK